MMMEEAGGGSSSSNGGEGGSTTTTTIMGGLYDAEREALHALGLESPLSPSLLVDLTLSQSMGTGGGGADNNSVMNDGAAYTQ